MGGKIVEHSFRLLFRNLSDALKISVGPYLIGILVCIAIAIALGIPSSAFSATAMRHTEELAQAGGAAVLGVLICAFILLFVSGWVAVSWHRYVLREEYPGILPSLADKPIWAYVGRNLVLALVLILIAIPLGFVLGLAVFPVASGLSSDGAMIASVGLVLVLATIMFWMYLRWGLVLPAIAVGRPMTMSDSWNATKPLSGAIFTALLILVALNLVVSLVVGLVLGDNIVSAIISLVIDWISLMIGISILTTLYGHIVEGRPID